MRRYTGLAVAVLVGVLLSGVHAHAKKPEIIRCDAQYLDKAVKISVQWQSTEPIVTLKAAAGKDVKDVKVDPYSNKRNPDGYAGEVDVVLQTEPAASQESIPYSIQIEDEDGQKSRLLTGKVMIPGAAAKTATDDQWGKEKLAGTAGTDQSGQQGDIIGKLRQVAQALAPAPRLQDVKVNNPGSGIVTFQTRATHSVGLKEISFRVFDAGNQQVDSQQLETTGTVWEGTSQGFSLSPGNYFVIVQATDGGGSTSPERRAYFTVKGADTASSSDTQLPQLTVTILPQDAADKGGQWRVAAGEWKNSGESIASGLGIGWVDVEFKDVQGWKKPETQKASIEAGKTATISGTYVQGAK